MDFFKSVFSDDPSAASSSESDHPDSKTTQNPNTQISSVTKAWGFGSTLLKTIATKSESVIENYKQEIEDFSAGLKKETAIVRQAARRAVKDLPARFESGAAVAQNSLESVGEAIDNISSTVSVIIIQGKDSIFNVNDEDSDSGLMENSDDNSNNISKPYSRVHALITAVQCDMKTYCEEPEEAGDYEEWKKGFLLEEKSDEIQDMFKEKGVIWEIYDEVVDGKVDHQTFWTRYFFRIYRVRRAYEARVKLVKRAIEGEEDEELSWDVDDDDEDEEDSSGSKLKDVLVQEVKENEERVVNTMLHGDDEGVEECEYEVKSAGVAEENSNDSELHNEKIGPVMDDKVSPEGKNDNVSDYSVISSQRSSHEEVDIGWDEIEDIGSGDDNKAAPRSNPVGNLQNRLNVDVEDEEDLTWDIEDEDDDDEEEPIKS